MIYVRVYLVQIVSFLSLKDEGVGTGFCCSVSQLSDGFYQCHAFAWKWACKLAGTHSGRAVRLIENWGDSCLVEFGDFWFAFEFHLNLNTHFLPS